MSTLLSVTGLRKYYPVEGSGGRWGRRAPALTVRAVEDVSFDVARGEMLTIVGESGCGKTTVAKMLVGLVAPSAGTVNIDGRRLGPERARDERRLIQLVAQNPWSALNRRRTVRHALEQPLAVHEPAMDKAARRRRVEEMVERVGLSVSHLDGYPRDVSGGELARLVLARALLADPKVIVLDEPTASLDASVKATVANLLLELKDDLGIGFVLITHEIAVARRIADRAAVMYLGRFVETGPVERVLYAPQHPYAQMLLASAASAEPGAEPGAAARGEVPSAIAPPAGCAYHPRCPHESPQCRAELPPLLDSGEGAAVACHHTRRLLKLAQSRIDPTKENSCPSVPMR